MLFFAAMIEDSTRITRYRNQVAAMIHDLTLFSSDREGMKLKDIAVYLGISLVSCSRAYHCLSSLSYLPFSKLQELYFNEFGHEYGK